MNCLSANELPKTSQKQDIGTPATLDCFRASTFFRNTLYTPVLGGRLAADGGTVQSPAGQQDRTISNGSRAPKSIISLI
mgnify:CR=1 FL=1